MCKLFIFVFFSFHTLTNTYIIYAYLYVIYKTNSPWLRFSAISSILSSTLSYLVLYYNRWIALQVHLTYWQNENYNRIQDTTRVIHTVFIEFLRYVINIY